MSKIEELTHDLAKFEAEITEIEDKLLALKADYDYEDLYHDMVVETDSTKKFSNRVRFNSTLNKKIDTAYLYSIGLLPSIVFTMSEQSVHSLIIDERYNFGGCSIENEEDTLIRLNGESVEAVDQMIWQMITQSIDLLGSIDNDNEQAVKTGRKISLLISKFV
ncbi:recombinase family protein, partial [Vibrio sp. 10N.222.55.E8]